MVAGIGGEGSCRRHGWLSGRRWCCLARWLLFARRAGRTLFIWFCYTWLGLLRGRGSPGPSLLFYSPLFLLPHPEPPRSYCIISFACIDIDDTTSSGHRRQSYRPADSRTRNSGPCFLCKNTLPGGNITSARRVKRALSYLDQASEYSDSHRHK